MNNKHFLITTEVWGRTIPEKAYKQINNNCRTFEKFARYHNIKITFTDAGNRLPELHSGSDEVFLSNKLAIEVEKMPSLIQRIRKGIASFTHKFTKEKAEPKGIINVISYYDKNSEIPKLEANNKIGFFVNYEPYGNKMNEQIDLKTIVEFLQNAVGKKSRILSHIK